MEGYWISQGDGKYKCSFCGRVEKMNAGFLFSFCPHCGKQIDKEASKTMALEDNIRQAQIYLHHLVTSYFDAKRDLEIMKMRKPRLEKAIKEYKERIPNVKATIAEWEALEKKLKDGGENETA